MNTHVVINGLVNDTVRPIDGYYNSDKVLFTGSEVQCWAYINKVHELAMNNEPIQRSHCYDRQF
jgi:hypothetical protein